MQLFTGETQAAPFGIFHEHGTITLHRARWLTLFSTIGSTRLGIASSPVSAEAEADGPSAGAGKSGIMILVVNATVETCIYVFPGDKLWHMTLLIDKFYGGLDVLSDHTRKCRTDPTDAEVILIKGSTGWISNLET